MPVGAQALSRKLAQFSNRHCGLRAAISALDLAGADGNQPADVLIVGAIFNRPPINNKNPKVFVLLFSKNSDFGLKVLGT